MIYELDDIILFSKRHSGETIRQIIRYDSGYLKDLMLKNDEIIFSNECFEGLKRLTKGHRDNWENPSIQTNNILCMLKPYGTPYLYDFNDEKLEVLNYKRLKQTKD